jgi:hypothetical protein
MKLLIFTAILASSLCFAQSAKPMDTGSITTVSDVAMPVTLNESSTSTVGEKSRNYHIITSRKEHLRMTQEKGVSSPIYQLRIYEVSPDLRDVFHNRFKKHALRIMKRYGFNVVALWESSSVSNFEFVYILKWPDEATMERQWKLFLADSEWIEIKKKTVSETGEPVRRVTGRILNTVEYSPAFNPG